ncbi:MAG TPA: hypothetical protein VH280_25160 [Verrucomicrobiae bacterium]|jgi:hypothetical protein|nr:hypothetical protein [Verrucomicrobiae bacterium]
MKRLSAIGVLASTVAVAALCGCASKSSDSSSTAAQPAAASQPAKPAKDKRPIEQRLAVGMTMDDVKSACGNPKNVSANSDGSATWIYNDSEKAFIPYYSLGGGKIHYVTVIFGTDGKVKSWSSGSNGMY